MAEYNTDVDDTQYTHAQPFPDEHTESIFGSEDSQNYLNFLKINSQIKPATSTQKLHKNKFKYNCLYQQKDRRLSTSNMKENIMTTSPLYTVQEVSIKPKTFESSTQTEDSFYHPNTVCQQNQILIKSLLKEVKFLRHEQHKLEENNRIGKSKSAINLLIPSKTVENFKELDDEMKSPEYEQALTNTFKMLNDASLEKYIRACLRCIITDEAACKFSWFGHNENIPVKSYTVMNIIKETAMAKYPTARVGDIISIIKRWFQYAKDRKRKANNSRVAE